MTSTEELQARAEQTRSDLRNDLTALKRKSKPKRIAADAADRVKERGRELATEASERVRADPVPAVLIGVSVVLAAWLLTRLARSM